MACSICQTRGAQPRGRGAVSATRYTTSRCQYIEILGVCDVCPCLPNGGMLKGGMHNLTATSEPQTPRSMLANVGKGLGPCRMAGGWEPQLKRHNRGAATIGEQQLKWMQSGSSS